MNERLVWVPFLVPTWAAAQTWGGTVLLSSRRLRDASPVQLEAVVAHELVHVDQWRRYGTLGFALRYLWGLVVHGYARHPLELEAGRDWPQRVTRARELLDRR